MQKIPVIAVVGPTACGKSDLAVDIAKELDGEIVSCDSMQIYKGMSIASAAPTAAQKKQIKHHLVEFLDSSESYSVADYVNSAKEVIFDINRRGKLAVVVGGTGLYVNSLLQNIQFSPQKTDLKLRESLSKQYDDLGGEKMLESLKLIDPEYAAILHFNDKKRIVRAFEVYKTTGQNVTELSEKSRIVPSPFDALYIGITYKDRQVLYDRINKRVDIMLENGLLAEAEAVYKSAKGTAAQAIGHKELFGFFEGEQTLDEAVENLKMQTRRYAKRQMTWFSKFEQINWIYPDVTPDVEGCAMKIINDWRR